MNGNAPSMEHMRGCWQEQTDVNGWFGGVDGTA